MDRNYPRLAIEDFGKVLLDSNDLDPVYVALYKMIGEGDMDHGQLKRWLLAYILCYHCGVACWMSEKTGDKFFDHLMVAASNVVPSPLGGRWPRSHERRHWRGTFAEMVVAKLRERYTPTPEHFIWELAKPIRERSLSGFDEGLGKEERLTLRTTIPFSVLSGRVMSHYGFGDWSSFKLADLLDRLGLAPIDFTFADVIIYKDPVLAAEMVFRQKHNMPDGVKVKPEGVKAVFDYLINHFSNYSAPPLHDRPVGVPEVESQLCKYKSHLHGRYPLYNDIREIHEGLELWSQVSETARKFQNRMPKFPLTE